MFKTLAQLSAIPFAFVAADMARKHDLIKKQGQNIQIPYDIPLGISFYDKVIVKRTAREIIFFSARCPHLGCIINHMENDQLVCPCHGSHFDQNGQNLSGPAASPLKKLAYKKDDQLKQFIVQTT